MTRDEAIEKYEHYFAGMLLDAWSQNRTGEAQALFVRLMMAKAKLPLGLSFDAGFKAGQEETERLHKPADKRELFDKKKGRAEE